MSDIQKHQEAIIEQGYSPYEDQQEPQAESVGNMLGRVLRRWYIVLLVFIVTCGAGIPAIWFLIEPVYTVTGAIRVAPILPNILTGEADRGEISNYQNFLNSESEVVLKDQVVDRVADELVGKNLSFFEDKTPGLMEKLKAKLGEPQTKPDPVARLKAAIRNGVITASPASRAEFIEVTAHSRSAAEGKQIVDAFINAYMAVQVNSSIQSEAQKLATLESQKKALTEKLQRQRDAINQLGEEYGTTTLGGRQDMMLQRVTSLLEQLTEAEAERINLEAQVQYLEQAEEQPVNQQELLSMRNEYVNSDPTIQELSRSIVQLEQDLIVAKQNLASGNPVLKQKADLLESFKSRLENRREEAGNNFDEMVTDQTRKTSDDRLRNAQIRLEQAKVYEQRLRDVLSEEDTETIQLGRKQLRIEDLQFELELVKDLYNDVTRRIEELQVERQRPARISAAYNAEIASVRDKRKKYSAALLFGALAGSMGLAFLRDKADRSLRTPQEVARKINIRVLGTTTGKNRVPKALLPQQLAEDYQAIRANLGLLDGGVMPKKLVVTSPAMREGKTTFAINLASSLARSGQRVLLIDGDLRKPDIARVLGLPRGSTGLQDVLFGTRCEDVLCKLNSTGMDVLAADSRNTRDAYELLSSPLTPKCIAEISRPYDHVIIDTPPLLAFPDALLWAKMADSVVLTSFAGRTKEPDLRQAKERLAEVKVKVLGAVVGNVPASHSYYRYAYGYYADKSGQRRSKSAVNHNLLLPAHHKEKSDNEQKGPDKKRADNGGS